MALPTLEDVNIVKQKCRSESRSVGVAEALRSLWKHMENMKNPDLYIEFFSGLSSGEQVISDSACKLYAVYAIKPSASTTTTFLKVADHATAVQAGAALVVPFVGTGGGGQNHCLVFHDGLKMATGVTIGSVTAGDGTTDGAAADVLSGFAIVGAP
ncbi:MAG: hypothetical protein ABWY78_06225 [Microvirga sp.]